MQVAGTCLRAYCKHMELYVMSIWDLNTLGILLINQNQTLVERLQKGKQGLRQISLF